MGPRASLKDEEGMSIRCPALFVPRSHTRRFAFSPGKLIPELSQYVGGRGAKREEQEESAEPKLFPVIPPDRYPPKPSTMNAPPRISPPSESHGGDRDGEQKPQAAYPEPTPKQMFMRAALTSQLSFYRQSDYYIDHEDLARDRGAVFQAKKVAKISLGMCPAYYPEEITKQARPRKRLRQVLVTGGGAEGAGKAAGRSADVRKLASSGQVSKDAVMVTERLETLERKEERGNQEPREFEEEEEEHEEEYEDGDDGLSDDQDPYGIYDDDDDGQDDDEENQPQGGYFS